MSALTTRLSLVAALFASSTAFAAGSGLDDLRLLPPNQRSLALQLMSSHAAAPGLASKLDTTPPTVLAVNAGKTVDASKTNNQLLVDLSVSDDLSGLMLVFVTARSPSGLQTQGAGQHMGSWPSFKGQVAIRFGGFAEPGTWQIERVYGSDVNGNAFNCEAACMGALGGNLSFTVSGSKADTLAPTLLSGKIATPAVSLSTPAKGTELQAPFVRLQLNTADTGGSGTAGGYATFCLANQSNCFSTWSENWVIGQKKSVLYGFTSLWNGMPTGTYVLRDVTLNDHGGASVTYTSTAFGGSTDFAPLFPSGTTVNVTP